MFNVLFIELRMSVFVEKKPSEKNLSDITNDVDKILASVQPGISFETELLKKKWTNKPISLSFCWNFFINSIFLYLILTTVLLEINHARFFIFKVFRQVFYWKFWRIWMKKIFRSDVSQEGSWGLEALRGARGKSTLFAYNWPCLAKWFTNRAKEGSNY